jgi:hypothetical protein
MKLTDREIKDNSNGSKLRFKIYNEFGVMILISKQEMELKIYLIVELFLWGLR